MQLGTWESRPGKSVDEAEEAVVVSVCAMTPQTRRDASWIWENFMVKRIEVIMMIDE